MNATYGYYGAGCADFLKNAGKLWYIVKPSETTFRFAHEVPDYQQQVWFPFFVLIALEQAILSASKKSRFRLNDQITSLSHWLFQESGRILFRGAEYYAYIAIHERYSRWELAWDSAWTWYATALGVDFCYYWVHRSNHEVHLLWAHHQVHHSSEEFNLAVGLRQSIVQHWCNFVFYLPLAFFVPPSHFIVHNQFNLIYQLWIHTTVIDDLGPLEWIFNTPKHHRVHHGCNLYCLDKNYGGVLIIWDRLFGTYQAERKSDEIVYGLVVSPRSFNPLYLQTFYTRNMIANSLRMNSWRDKIDTFWKGPSWIPGTPRLGLDAYKINVTSRIKYDTYLPAWQNCYVCLHFCMVLYKHLLLCDKKLDLQNFTGGILIMNNICTLTAIGLLFDKSRYAEFVELARCAICSLFATTDCLANSLVYYAHVASCCVWIVRIVHRLRSKPTHLRD